MEWELLNADSHVRTSICGFVVSKLICAFQLVQSESTISYIHFHSKRAYGQSISKKIEK